jgi:hypothetical protein
VQALLGLNSLPLKEEQNKATVTFPNLEQGKYVTVIAEIFHQCRLARSWLSCDMKNSRPDL